jgi:hypothetical protein
MVSVATDEVGMVCHDSRGVREMAVLVHHNHTHTVVDIERAWLWRIV